MNHWMNFSDKLFIILKPKIKSDLLQEFQSCLSQLDEILRQHQLRVESVLKQTIFICSKNNKEYYQQLAVLNQELQRYYPVALPPTSFVAQPPENQLKCALELIILDQHRSVAKLERKGVNGLSYSLLKYPATREVYAAGLTQHCPADSLLQCAEAAFDRMESILNNEKLSFSEVVRQWNYIENILRTDDKNRQRQQHYQIFNDVRSRYYAKSSFVNGYPAATGIGTNAGGVILEFLALSASPDVQVVPIRNPRQINAYSYSQEMLIGKPKDHLSDKAAPKFERAKWVSIQKAAMVYISGTASIIGQESTSGQNAQQQTVTTIENIQRLISDSNLQNHSIETNSNPLHIRYLRVYVKNRKILKEVKAVCQQYYPDVPVLYLLSDICRKELLVEIEGIAGWK